MSEATLALARRVRELLSVPERWMQGAWARNAKGKPVSEFADDAVAWCIAGAASLLAGRAVGCSAVYWGFMRVVRRLTGDVSVANWQDGRTHAEVLALLDRVIGEMAA